MVMHPRVVLFAESFHEVNGVALTCREFLAYAGRRGVPFLCVAPGRELVEVTGGTTARLELPPHKLSFAVDADMRFDLAFPLHLRRLRLALERFHPDVVHITGPGHIGFLGAILAHERRIPLVASWHTNVHEFGARRLNKLMNCLPPPLRAAASLWAEKRSLDATLRFYRIARLLFAPNPELAAMLESRTGRPCHLMLRGVDTELFSPARRTRKDAEFVIGYVGRLSPEKDVRFLLRLEERLQAAGMEDYRFLIVGQGSERIPLAAALRRATLPGVLKGEALAQAYANMDVFVFPSETDTFGNVVLEACASGIPVVVTGKGGPKFLVQGGETGFVAGSEEEFTGAVLTLYRNPQLRDKMAKNARRFAEGRSWDPVFDQVYRRYGCLLPGGQSDPETKPESTAPTHATC